MDDSTCDAGACGGPAELQRPLAGVVAPHHSDHTAGTNHHNAVVDDTARTLNEALISEPHPPGRFAQLKDLTVALSRAVTPLDVATTVVRQCRATLGTCAAAVGVYTPDRSELVMLGIEGYSDAERPSPPRFPADGASPVADSARTSEVLTLPNSSEYAERYPALVASYPSLTAGAAVALPLLTEGETLGALALRWSQERSFDSADMELFVTISQMCALALARARLFEAEKVARHKAEEAELRLAFLAHASALLATSLDYEATLSTIADVSVPQMGDWCAVHVAYPGGAVRQVAVAHVDKERLAWAKELGRRYPYDPNQQFGVPQALRTGQASLVCPITEEMLRAAARNDEHFEFIRQLRFRAGMIVPMRGHGAILGAISFATTEDSGRDYVEADLQTAQELAHRAALAIENARLFRAEQHLAAIITSSEDGIVSKDLNGIVTSWNKAAERIYGWPASEIIGKSKALVIPPDLPNELPGILNRIKAGERIEHYDTSRIRKDGRRIDVSISVSPVRDAAGKIVGASTIARDITDRKAAERAILESQERLRDLNVRLQRAMAETHHRVKNNLQIVAALVDMELYTHGETIPAHSIEQLARHIRTLSALHDILTRQAKADADLEYLSSRTVIEELLPIIESMLHDRKIALTCDDAQIPIRAAAALVVLINELVTNARKHGQGLIRVAFQANHDRGRLQVEDEGPGFPEDFESRRGESTGLDLIESLAAWDLSGTVKYDNAPEGGARVVIDFPLSPQA